MQRVLFDQQALSLVAFPGTAPLQDDGGESGELAGPAGDRGVARRQEHQVIEVGAAQAESAPVAGQEHPCLVAELLVALAAAPRRGAR